MRGFLAIVEREIYERRLLGLVALVLGLAAVALPAVPGLRPGGVSPEDLRSGMALGFALLLTLLMALFLGGSIIASDLAERRLGFYFARPLSGRVIWGGKIAAAVALIFGAGFIVLAPAALAGGGFTNNGVWGEGLWNLSGPAFFQLTAAGLLFLLLAAHAASVIVRARSPWVLLDLAALALVVFFVETSVRRLATAGVLPTRLYWIRGAVLRETGVSAWILGAFALAGFVALALAGIFQVTAGRTDPRRGHRFRSATLWGTLLAVALLVAASASWVLAAGPGDLRTVERFVAAPAGPWIAFTGAARHRPGYYPSFLYDLDSGRFVRARFGLINGFYNGVEPFVRFSADGRRAVWVEYDGAPPNPPLVLYRLDLDRPGAEPVRSTTSFQSPPGNLALSPDGRLLALYDEWNASDRGSRLTVQETDSGRLLASVRYDSRSVRPRLVFTRSGRLRVYETSLYGRPGFPDEVKEAPLDIFELDFASSPARLEPTGRMPAVHGFPGWSLDPAADRILLRGKEGVRLCDGRTGAVLAQVGDSRSFGYCLADGRIAVLDRPLGIPWTLRVLSADGRSELRRFGFGGARRVIVAGQPSPGLLRVVVSSGSNRSSWDLRLLELESGASRSLGARRLSSPEGGRHTQVSLPLGRVDGVIWFDPMSFQERVVLKGS
jgi:hypothetical protein